MNQQHRPPGWATQLLKLFCASHLLEEMQGDLEELYHRRAVEQGPAEAARRYVSDVLSVINPFAVKRKAKHPAPTGNSPVAQIYHSQLFSNNRLIPLDMFRHFVLLSFRNIRRFKGSFLINLIGLSTGLACVILIFLWVSHELGIDHFYKNDQRVYQVMHNLSIDDGSIQTIGNTPGLLPEALVKERPEIEFATAVVPSSWFGDEGIISVNEKKLTAKPQFISTDYFEIFSTVFTEGDGHAIADGRYNIAITEELATKLFGEPANAIGKAVSWNHGEFNGTYQVSGVFKKVPKDATDQFDVLLNYELFLDKRPWVKEWSNSDPSTFVLLKQAADVNTFNRFISNFLKTKLEQTKDQLFIQRYSDKYLHNNYENGHAAGGRIEYVKLFSVIAVFILLIACINFMNLSTAKASRRMKEVGIKKAVGAGRGGLAFQFLTESVFTAFLSLLMAILLVWLLIPGFNNITGKELVLKFNWKLITSLVGLTFFTGLIAGSYPALYLSGFNPVVVLKGKLKGSAGELWARKGLVVFQFSLSVILIVAVVVVYQQIQFVQQKNLGFNRENIIHFQVQVDGDGSEAFFAKGGPLEKKVQSYMEEVRNIPGVIYATNVGNHNLTGTHGGFSGMDWKEGNDDEKMSFSNLQSGFDFIETMGISIVAGRSFSRSYTNEDSKVVFNEEAIRRMGLKDPIGKKVKFWGVEKEIIGVARNFHFESLYRKVEPCVIQLEPRVPFVMVKVASVNQDAVIGRLKQFQQAQNPGIPFSYRFVDEDYQAMYIAEQRVSILSKYFAGITIIISCLGLFGLAVFTAQRRRREIGIRKVLGSGEFSIIGLLSKEFMQMILIAVVIALPVSYLLVKNWLAGFAYAISLQWWFFAGAGLVTLAIGWLAVAAQTISAAKINPIRTLREE